MASDKRVFLYDGYQAKPRDPNVLMRGLQADSTARPSATVKPKLPTHAPSAVQKPKKNES